MVDTFIEWDVAQATLKGENKSGDGYLVKPFAKNVLVAVVDGLGHGDEAAAAAKIAVDVLDANAHDSVISLFKRRSSLRTPASTGFRSSRSTRRAES